MKSLLLFAAITIGLLFPGLAIFSNGIRYFVMVMLMQGFLTIVFDRSMFSKELLYVLIANIIIPIPVYLIAQPFGELQAQAAYLIAATPTAVASPIVIEIIKKKTEFVAMSVVTTNITAVLTFPIIIPFIGYGVEPGEVDSEFTIILSVLITIIGPLLVALVFRWIGGRVLEAVIWTKRFSLHIWLIPIVLACATARDFIIENEVPSDLLFSLGSIALIVCILNFGLGYLIGGKKYARESSQSLGQKNTMFSVWLGLTFLNPISAIAPVAYIIFQNIYNALQIFVFEWQDKKRR